MCYLRCYWTQVTHVTKQREKFVENYGCVSILIVLSIYPETRENEGLRCRNLLSYDLCVVTDYGCDLRNRISFYH